MALYEDIAYNMLSWLPAKAIYKFKSVSKSFSKISEDPTFITKQVENSLARDDTCIFIQPYMYERRGVVELHPLPRNQPSSGISNDFLKSLSNSARVLSSSNGLILYSTNEHPTKLFISNPITKSRSLIPNPINHKDPYLFDETILLECYQGDDDNYSLFHFERQNDELPWSGCGCNVYKSKEGVWKTMKGSFTMGVSFLKINYMPVLLNGLLYIISDGYPCYSMIYNMENGVTKMLRLPKQLDFDKSVDWKAGIFRWGKVSSSTQFICLVKFYNSVLKVWFLKDYESTSWQKVLEVRVEAMGVKEKDPKVTSYIVMNGDLLIFAIEKKVYSYGLAGERYMMIEEISEHNCGSKPCFVPYTDTLRPC